MISWIISMVRGDAFTSSMPKHLIPRPRQLIRDLFARSDPSYFRHFGVNVFIGRQGSGKTTSAGAQVIKYMTKKKSKCILITNVPVDWTSYVKFKLRKSFWVSKAKHEKSLIPIIKDLQDRTLYYDTLKKFRWLFETIHNCQWGVIYFVDEIHTYVNAQDSGKTPKDIFKNISQMRKQHKLILGTSQIWRRVGIAVREQTDHIITCSTMFGVLTIRRVFYGDEFELADDDTGVIVSRPVGLPKLLWHNQALRSWFDTFLVIKPEDYTIGYEMNNKKSKWDKTEVIDEEFEEFKIKAMKYGVNDNLEKASKTCKLCQSRVGGGSLLQPHPDKAKGLTDVRK